MPELSTHPADAHPSDDERLIETIVTALYRQILKREPDKTGLSNHARRLLDQGLGTGFPQTLAAFMNSPEYHRTFVSRAFGLSSAVSAAIFPTFKHVVSLGTQCYSSAMLQKLGLKRYSAPFDWLFSSCEMISHCIDDDFATFLDKAHYAPDPEIRRAPKSTNRCDHLFYRSAFGVRHVFNHHDPTLDDDYAYFARCIERFRSVLRSGDHALFFLVTHARDQNRDNFLRLSDTLRAASSNTHLLFVEVGREMMESFPQVVLRHSMPHGKMYSICPTSKWEPLSFADQINDAAIARLIGQYPMALSSRENS